MAEAVYALIAGVLVWTLWRDLRRGGTSRWTGMGMRVHRAVMPIPFWLSLAGRVLALALMILAIPVYGLRETG
jgi:hypothetical protein